MNKRLLNFVMFTTGAVIGSVATWQYVKNKYEKIAQEEINFVKDVYHNREHKIKEKENELKGKEIKLEEKKEKLQTYENIANIYKTSLELASKKVEEVKTVSIDKDKPYVIPPEEFGDIFEYTTISLTYYADGVLTDEDDEVIEHIDDTVGSDSLTHFGEYEDDAVFVRNDRLNCDYEILKDHRNYSDVVERY